MKRRAAAIAAASGLVFAASTPPLDFQPGILFGLALFAYSLEEEGEGPVAHTGAGRGFLFGAAANLFALRFVPAVIERFTSMPLVLGVVALLLLAAGQALPWVVCGAVARWLAHRGLVPRWLSFALGVYLATFVPAIFPWTPAGGLSRWPVLLQTADLVGERGVSFLLAAASALVLEGRRVRRLAWIGAALFACLLVHGLLLQRSVDAARAVAKHARIALVQPDFDALLFWQAHDPDRGLMVDRLAEITRDAEASGAELTVWPESAYPYPLDHDLRRSPRGTHAILQRDVHGPVLTGAYMKKKSGAGTNSAIFVDKDGSIAEPYDKRHLLWFGETVPLADVFPVLGQIFARGTGLDPGTESVRFTTGDIHAAVLNCYEDTLPVAGREAMAVRPNVLVNITNDSWFYGSWESELHLRMAVMRSVETRRDLVRSVNRGPTSWVDAAGRIRDRRLVDPSGKPVPPLLADVALLESSSTLYVAFGDWPLALLLLALVLFRWRRVSATPPG